MPVLNYLREFAPKAQSAFVRRTYARELFGEISFSFPMAMIEASSFGIVAKILFDVGPLALATILAAPNFANFTSPMWASIINGRRKPAALAMIQGGILLLVLAVAMVPVKPSSGTVLVALYVLARCLYAGAMTTRSVIWNANYPRQNRSRITGRLMLINTLMLATMPVAAGVLFERFLHDHPWLFRAVYISAAVLGVGGVLAYMGLRVRRERMLNREEMGLTLGSADSPGPPVRVSALRILMTDHAFRSYMVWQYFGGVATMAGNAAMIAFIANQADALPTGWHFDLPWPLNFGSYLYGILLATACVQFFVALSIPFWAHYLDTVHIAHFRTRHGFLWIVTQASSLVVTAIAAIHGLSIGWLFVLLLIPRISQGIVFGGGRLAWQLGHMDFADQRHAATYMAIHQMLTGIRGFTAPFLGVLLYTGWAERDLLGLHIPAWHGIGYWVFAFTTACAIIAWYGFILLNKQVGIQATTD